jgi:hypothetical protein
MSADELVRALCARHGLPPTAGAPFLPLVRKALASADDSRERILRLVDEALADRADALANERVDAAADDRVLVAVARVLHPWTPSEAMLDLGSSLDRKPGDAA